MSSKYRIIPLGGGGITPEGTLEIRSEGVFDVTDYASVDVDIFDDTTTKTITNNGTYNASDDNVLGYSQVTVAVPASAVDSGTLTIEPITQNVNLFTQDVTGYRAIAFEVAVPNDTETITITQNGTYTPTSPNIGFSEVTVNVTGPVYDPDYLCFTAAASNSSVGMSLSEAANPNIEYSTDLINWTPWDFSVINLPNIGDKVYMRGDNPNGVSNNVDTAIFSMSGSISASGDICTLLRYDEPVDTAFGFHKLFSGCTSLVKAPDLLVQRVLHRGCSYMFEGCTGLTQMPSLTATSLSSYCYEYMFKDCTGLTQLSILPATSLASYCYQYMFQYCTSLTSVPTNMLPSTSLSLGCYYYIFYGCSSLTQPPELPATHIPKYGYSGIFHQCSGLTSAPNMSHVTTIDSQSLYNAFRECTSLTAGPDLSNASTSGTSCMSYCFYGSTKISDVTAPNAQDLTVNSILNNWLNGAGSKATGTKVVRVPTGATITTGSNSGIPSGWTRVNY